MIQGQSLPRITIVGFHSCIRAYKIGIALKASGYTVNWVCSTHLPSHISLHHFDGMYVYMLGKLRDDEQPDPLEYYRHFRRTIANVDDKTDVYIAYNEPNWFVQQIKLVSKKPVIWDLHDLTSERDFIERPDEALEFKLADAILTQGYGYTDYAKKKRPDLAEKGLIDFCFSGCNRCFWPRLDSPMVQHGGGKLGGVVYEGGIASGQAGGSEFRYRWWLPFMEQITAQNIPMSIHPASSGNYDLYAKAGIRVVPPLQYHALLEHLTIYDWGLVGNAVHHPAFDSAWPNKLFEYLTAGLPVMVHDAKEVETFVEQENIGVVVRNPKDVKLAYSSAPDFAEGVKRAREKFAMENEVIKVIGLVNRVLERSL